ncbi:MAG: aldo/keto reductase [Pseudomonadota bacterium]
MTIPTKAFSGFSLTNVGLGCARLGSMTGATTEEAKALILRARDAGVTFFDTAASYGQGDSERILGRLVGSDDKICLVTKVGKQVSFKARLLQPVKGIVRSLARNSSKMHSTVRQSRGAALPVNFDAAFLTSELTKCHRRTGLKTIPMVMLHSVDAATVKEGAAIEVLERAQTRGDIRLIGASVDDLEAAEATLADSRIQAVQVPYVAGDSAMADWAIHANRAGKLVVAREVFGGVAALPAGERAGYIQKNLLRSTSDAAVGVTLVGTTKTAHFDEILGMLAPKTA